MGGAMDYLQSHAAGIGALIGGLSFLGVVLWGIFKLAVEQATGPRFTKLEQGVSGIATDVILLKQGQESINKRLDRIEFLLERERV